MTKLSFPAVGEQLERLRRGAVDLVAEDELRAKLERSRASGVPLVVKVGFDPTAPDIHLGHTVLLRKMREFQDLGHRLVYVIGDTTASIGDPSGRSKTRPPLTSAEIEAHAATYTEQAFKVLDDRRTEIRRNSEWLTGLGTDGVIQLAARYTVARMLERRDFRERLEQGSPVSIHELIYPLMQAYDSVVLEADVELGGTDQLFNLNVGRDIMPHYGLEPQVILTMPLLEGTDGTEKMSKSLGNTIGVDEDPVQSYGKAMSISDELMLRWHALLMDGGQVEADAIAADIRRGRVHPREAKAALAHAIVARFHGAEAADHARDQFEQVFARKELPDEIPEVVVSCDDRVWLPKLVVAAGLAPSTSEARRLVKQGAVRVDGERVTDDTAEVEAGGEKLLQVGKRRFKRVRFGR